MSKEENLKLLESMMSGAEVIDQVTDINDKPDDKTTIAQDGEGNDDGTGDGKEAPLELPKYQGKLKAPKQTAEESASILRRQRDEARAALAEKEALLEQASKQGDLFGEVKKLINKDEVTPDDLKQIFEDYEFTKKERESLKASLDEAKGKLREYDISTSDDFIESYVKPIQINVEALKAEVCPIVGNEYVPVPASAANALDELIESNNITPSSVKIALNKIREAYDAEDIDYEMPSVKNVTNYLLDIQKTVIAKNKAVEEWETIKAEKQREAEESRSQRNSIIQAKSRQERRKMAMEFLDRFVNKNDDFDYLAEMQGAEHVMQTVSDSHSYLTDLMDDPSKAPAYDALLEFVAKAKLYDSLIEEKKSEMKLAVAKKDKVKIENLGRPSNKNLDKSDDPAVRFLRENGVSV